VPKAYRPQRPRQSNPSRDGKAHPRLALTTGPECDGTPAPALQPSAPTDPVEAAAKEPFAALPHRIAADPRLTALDVRVLLALLYFAKNDPHCWPSAKQLRARVHVKSDRSVQESLRRLIEHGHIRRDDDTSKPTWRRIILLWRVGEGPVPNPPDRTADPLRKLRPTEKHRWSLEKQLRIRGEKPQRRRRRPRQPRPPADGGEDERAQ
jgi:hypothetical protein